MFTILYTPSVVAQPEQYAKVSTGFWDGVTDPSFCRMEVTDLTFAEVECVATDAEQVTVYPPPNNIKTVVTSSGSSVVKARAGAGMLGASVYTSWIVGTDTYYGYAEARSKDVITISGGDPNGVATVAVGAIVNGGLGIYGSDAGADARAYFRFDGITSLTSDYPSATSNYDEFFSDTAYGEEVFDNDFNLLPPIHHYEYGIRYDYRYVDVALDAAGNGSFEAQLFLDLETSEDGDESLYLSAAAADYGDTINLNLQPWSSDFIVSSAAGWEIRPFDTALGTSPAPVTLTPEEIGIPEPTSLALLSLGGPLILRSFRRATLFTA